MRITFYLFYLFIRFFALIPIRGLHILSNFFAFVFYYFIPYRKTVIKENIQRSFPELSESEHKKIIKGFFHNFLDILLEGIRGFSISKKELLKRYVFVNPEVMDDLFDKGIEVICVGSHYANWEWGIMAAPLQLKHKLYVYYTPLTNKPIDEYMRINRKKWGTEMVPSRNVKRGFDEETTEPKAYFFGADQSPHSARSSHWMKFLNQDTACLRGPEFFAKRYNIPVVYFDVQRVKKGYYTLTLLLLEENPVDTKSGEITEKTMHTLEQIIKNKPEDYLWSHNRWKHKRENKGTE